MWHSAVLVVVVGCVISRVISVIDVKDNAILSGESLQDLLTRTKKSPEVTFGKKNFGKEDRKRTWNESPNIEDESGRLLESGKPESEVSAEITALLAEDIKERLENLKQLENSYNKLKSNLPNNENLNKKRKNKVDKPLNQEIKTILETNISEDGNLDDKESLRIARQYSEDGQHHQQFYGGGKMNVENTYTNQGIYQESIHSPMNIYGDRGDPYLAQDNPSVRTYGAAGIEGGEYDKEKKEHQSPTKTLKQLKQIIPNVINVLAEITTPAKPVQTAGHSVKPVHHHPVKKPEHQPPKPIGVHQPHQLGNKPTGIEPIFYSKQIIFGIGTDKKLHTKNYYGTPTPEVHNSPAQSYSPTQSYYPNSYLYYSPASYWAPHRDDYSAALNYNPEGNAYYPAVYSINPEAQISYDTPYSQGIAYIEPPSDKTYYPVDNSYNNEGAPYLVNEVGPAQKNGESIAKESSKSTLLMESVPTNLKNQTVGDIESGIKNLRKKIETIKVDLVDILKQTDSVNSKEPTHPEAVKRSPSLYRRQAPEVSGGSNKARKFFQGKFNEVTGKFDFVESDF